MMKYRSLILLPAFLLPAIPGLAQDPDIESDERDALNVYRTSDGDGEYPSVGATARAKNG